VDKEMKWDTEKKAPKMAERREDYIDLEEKLDTICDGWGFEWANLIWDENKWLDKKFCNELTKSLDSALKNLVKRKHDNRGSPPKDVIVCGKCKKPFYHILDGWVTEVSDYLECEKCLMGEGIV